MRCDDARLELTALAAGETGDRPADVERHVESCARCREDLGELRDTIAMVRDEAVEAPVDLRPAVLGAVEAIKAAPLLDYAVAPPPARLKRSVMAAVEAERRGTSSSANVTRLEPRRQWAMRIVAAAAILVTGAVVGSVITSRPAGDGTGGPGRIPEGHETQVLALEGSGPSSATVRHYRHDNFRVTLSMEGFGVTPPGHHYAVWVRGAEGDVAVGTFRLKAPDDFEIPFAIGVNPAEYPELVVTLEPNDGDPALTGKVVTEGRFDPASVQHGSYDP